MYAIYIQILKAVSIQIELDLDIFDYYLSQINILWNKVLSEKKFYDR